MAILVEIGAAAAELAPAKAEEVLANAWVSKSALLIWTNSVAVKFLAMCLKLAIA